MTTKLQRLYAEHGQSPWLDNLTRPYLREGTLARMVADGIRGVTANPTIFAKAIEGSDAYDDQFGSLIAEGRPVLDAYWDLVIDDVVDALGVLRPTFDASEHTDGFVSIEVAPELAHDAENAYLFKQGDPEGLSQRMQTLFTDPALHRRMAANSLEIIQKHALARTLEEFEAVYEDVGMRRRAQPAGHDPTPPTPYRKSMMSSRMG